MIEQIKELNVKDSVVLIAECTNVELLQEVINSDEDRKTILDACQNKIEELTSIKSKEESEPEYANVGNADDSDAPKDKKARGKDASKTRKGMIVVVEYDIQKTMPQDNGSIIYDKDGGLRKRKECTMTNSQMEELNDQSKNTGRFYKLKK